MSWYRGAEVIYIRCCGARSPWHDSAPPGFRHGTPSPTLWRRGPLGAPGEGGGPVIIFALRWWARAAPASADQISCDVCH
jgi:hypothetical protein